MDLQCVPVTGSARLLVLGKAPKVDSLARREIRNHAVEDAILEEHMVRVWA